VNHVHPNPHRIQREPSKNPQCGRKRPPASARGNLCPSGRRSAANKGKGSRWLPLTPPSTGPLGVAPRVIAAARRDLQEGLHRAQDDRERVEWLPAGVDALCAPLRVSGPSSEPLEEGRGPRGWAAPPEAAAPLPPQPLPSRCPDASVGCSRTPAEWPSTTTGPPCRHGCVPTPDWQSERPSASASMPTAPPLASPQPSLGSTVATPAELSLLAAPADEANDDGICCPPVGSISLRTRLGARTVQRTLRELVADRQISITGSVGGGAHHQTPTYVVHPRMPQTDATQTPHGCHSDTGATQTPVDGCHSGTPRVSHSRPTGVPRSPNGCPTFTQTFIESKRNPQGNPQ
jgi:hypothetical protein